MKPLLKIKFIPIPIFLFLVLNLISPLTVQAQEEDLHYQVVGVRGKPMVYRDENDETTRLRKGQTVDDGDRITTDSHSEVVLRLKGRAYVQIPPGSKIKITRLRVGDNKRLQSRINLISGRVLTQIDPGPPVSFEVTIGKFLCRAHGTLFDVSRKKEEVKVTAFEGSVVATSQGVVEMAKARQIMKYDHGRFRYKHYLKTEDEGRLEDWKGLLAEIREKRSQAGH